MNTQIKINIVLGLLALTAVAFLSLPYLVWQ